MSAKKRKPTLKPQLRKTISGHLLTRSPADVARCVWEVAGPTVVLAPGIVTIRPVALHRGKPYNGWIIRRGFDNRVGSGQTIEKTLAEGVRLGWLCTIGSVAAGIGTKTLSSRGQA